jgi:hypothetical protein
MGMKRHPVAPKILNDKNVLELLRTEVMLAGGQSAWAREHRYERTVLNRILSGHTAIPRSIINAAVVGLLLAALYDPVWTAGITNARDFALAIAAFLLLFMWQTPPWLVVVLCALGGAALSYL